MKYVAEDGLGQILPITNLIDLDEKETSDIRKAAALVVKINDHWYPFDTDSFPFLVYTVH